ncbi:SusD/RagB family nutrient-binding outer membrane lipoprotein [Flavivirga abyssicola]|uniref:SusD/RagB family nutrient-binding outer membrane lipoprotein n=1 Tax=Flavivirga abyssicola TaxID=3063533 RepID=UPI0026DF06C2|nr:SusD/RagB family nutrient-binding outer membrane lipoprotein [Flavivirga sp. MEBiC07777]WVK14392.1 SusD/RagB family nutrient-binding outer membrane lipoprotein [Flavivirga sp. MEBiC07777]
MKKLIFLLSSFLILSGCTKDFEAINTNPNNQEKASESLLLPTIIFDLSNTLVNQTYAFGDVISQYAANYEFNDIDIYRWQGDDRFWSPMYGILQDISDLKNIAKTNENVNYESIALILEAYIFSIITDSYGDVPMSEANKTSEGLISPIYDKQEDIYNALLNKLEEANMLINTSETVTGDILYGGDMLKWKKFANSLKLRLLIHTSNVQNIATDINTIINDSNTYPIFESNDDNAIYKYSGNFPDISDVSQVGGGRGYEYFLRIPTTHFINLLNDNNDPRLELWVSPKEGTNDRTLGTAPGQSLSDIGRPNELSRRSTEFFESATKIQGIFMTYSELNFILAEVRENGIINLGTAEEYYNTAVTASFNQWEVTIPDNFLSATVSYDNTTERLYEQKWLALYHTSMETWFDWKRTGKPNFIQAGSGNINSNKVPVRLQYPNLEQSVNTTNYNKASADMGGDTINASSWWW